MRCVSYDCAKKIYLKNILVIGVVNSKNLANFETLTLFLFYSSTIINYGV